MRAALALALSLVACQGATAPAPSPTAVAAATAAPRTPAPSLTAAAKPRGTALDDPFVIDLPTDGGFAVAADDGALASLNRASDASTQLSVIDLRTNERRPIATPPDRFVRLMPGALRNDLVTYVLQEERGGRAGGGQLVGWHVMVANWRTGTPPTEIDMIDGEIEADPRQNSYLPNPVTNGRDVVWLHAPRTGGTLGDVEVRRWSSGASAVAFAGEASYALDDDGRIAIARAKGTSAYELLLVDPSGASRSILTRDRGGAPYIAGPRIVWARAPGNPLAVTTVDVVDIGRGTSQPVTSDCPFIGATVRHVVFGCRDAGSRVVSVDDLKADDLKAFFFRADPHAILGRARDRWTVTPVAN